MPMVRKPFLRRADGHGEEKTVHGPHGCQLRLLDLLGGYTLQTRNPDSWEGWYWGAKHVWGGTGVGQMKPDCNCMADISANGEMVLFWGVRSGNHPMGTGWSDGQPALLLVDGVGYNVRLYLSGSELWGGRAR